MSRVPRNEYHKTLLELDKLAVRDERAPPRAMVLVDSEELYDPRVFVGGDPSRPGKSVPRRFLEALSGERRPAYTDSSGRLDLARAITADENPLTSRVIANRIWMHHFGEPLVETPSDFGARSAPPSHPDLLDHLALTLVEEGWSLKELSTERPTGAALPSPFGFRRYGESGIEVSELFEKTAAHIDDISIIRSMYADTPNHEQSMRLMNCGDERLPCPSLGAWLTYGMGTENRNLPGFVVLCPGLPVADVSNWRSAFLPGVYQGTHIDTRQKRVEELIDDIRNPVLSRRAQRRQLDLLAEMNRRHRLERREDAALEARIESFELAYRMQFAATVREVLA